MSKKNRCYLCGGKLTKGYCADCGLDNTKLERVHYHLNESNAARRLEGSINTGADIPKPKKEKKTAGAMKISGAGSFNREKQSTAGGRDMDIRLKPAGSLYKGTTTTGTSGYSYAGAGNPSGGSIGYTRPIKTKNKTTKAKRNSSSSGIMWIKIIPVILAAVVAVGGFAADFFEEKKYEFTSFVDKDESEEYDPYKYVERELADNGTYFETELEPGEYLVGTHLPEGNYEVELLEGDGYLDVNDYENDIYLWGTFGPEEDYEVTKMTDVRLFTGAKVTVDDDVKLKFTTKTGQVEAMELIPNPVESGFTLRSGEVMIAGTDFEAGVYDVQAFDGWSVLSYQVPTDAEYVENGMYERSLWLSSSGRDQFFYNLVLPEGTEISTEDGDIILTPSPEIGTIDYSEYYETY